MWDQRDCAGYLKTSAVLQAYVDQSISTNTFYNPAHFADRKVPTTLIVKNLMQAHMWGIKTFYYSLINKAGAKLEDTEKLPIHEYVNGHVNGIHNEIFEDDCESCKL